MNDAYKEWVYNEIFRAIKEQYEEAESEFHKDIKNTFKAGRALAYEEVKEIIENRLEALEEE